MASYSFIFHQTKAPCAACKAAIVDDLSFTESIKLRTRAKSKHLHLDCLDSSSLPDAFSLAKVDGFRLLTKTQQAQVKKVFKGLSDAKDQAKTDAKQTRAKQAVVAPPAKAGGQRAVVPKAAVKKAGSTAVKPRAARPVKSQGAYSSAEKEKLEQYKTDLGDKTVEQLKALSRLNDQKVTGTKQELIERVADGMTLGAIPKCPRCGGGRPRFDAKKGTYKCPGYMEDEDYVNCSKSFSMAELPRIPWAFS
jgi:hypothetical protein